MSNKFKNSARPLKDGERDWIRSDGCYTHDQPSPYLYMWSRLLQATISQAATKMLTGEFHDQQCGIYKCEGGCNIPGVNELVLRRECCNFDWDRASKKENEEMVRKCSDLISTITLEWNPEDPINSMFKSATDFVSANSQHQITFEDIQKAIEDAKCGGVFGGDALSYFFDHNPFDKFPLDRKYRKYCMLNHFDPVMTKAEVKQTFADEDLGEKLLKDLQDAQKEGLGGVNGMAYYSRMMACSPSRSDKGIQFWLNDGVYCGWHTEVEIVALCKKFREGKTSKELTERKNNGNE